MEISIENLEHVYMPNTPFEKKALQNINLHINSGEYVAIIGHTGSGKSTLVQHINGLLKPTTGTVRVGEVNIEAKKKTKNLYKLRQLVGMVFQYPEHQLFDETVEKDISFGPNNFGFSKDEVSLRIEQLLPLVGLQPNILNRSPFDLSGGQKRRVAIAGVLASKPSALILDEPTAGLDPQGRKQMMELFYKLHKQENLTTVLVTHNMDLAALYADKVVVMDKGKVVRLGSPKEVFRSVEYLHNLGLDMPQTLQFQKKLEYKFKTKLPEDIVVKEQLVHGVVGLIEKRF